MNRRDVGRRMFGGEGASKLSIIGCIYGVERFFMWDETIFSFGKDFRVCY